MSQSFTLNAGGAERPQVLANAIHFLQSLKDSESWKLEIKRAKRSRSLDQNAALWAVAYPPLREATGHSLEDLHEYFCGKVFGWTEYEVMGNPRSRPVRTTTTGEDGKRDVINTTAFAEFYATVQRIAAGMGVIIPDPDPFHGDAGRWAA